MKYFAALLMTLLSLHFTHGLALAIDAPVGMQLNILVPLKLQVYEDGIPTEKFILGTLLITNGGGKFEIFWDNVLISPLHSQKRVLLKSEHTYSRYDLFQDIAISQNSFSFIMTVGPQGNKIRISGNMNKNELFHTIRGEGVFKGLYAGDRSVTVEWKQVNKVILPYNEVH